MRRQLLKPLVLLAIYSLCISNASAEETWKTLFSKGGSVFQGKVLGKDGDIMVVQTRSVSQPQKVDTIMLNCTKRESKLIGGSFYNYLIEQHGSDYKLLKWMPFMKKTESHLCENKAFKAY